MADLLRADKPFTYGRKQLRPGDTFHTATAGDTMALTLMQQATLVEPGIEAPPADPVPAKRGRGRPKGSTKP